MQLLSQNGGATEPLSFAEGFAEYICISEEKKERFAKIYRVVLVTIC